LEKSRSLVWRRKDWSTTDILENELGFTLFYHGLIFVEKAILCENLSNHDA
jgi:hypothetical protein